MLPVAMDVGRQGYGPHGALVPLYLLFLPQPRSLLLREQILSEV